MSTTSTSRRWTTGSSRISNSTALARAMTITARAIWPNPSIDSSSSAVKRKAGITRNIHAATRVASDCAGVMPKSGVSTSQNAAISPAMPAKITSCASTRNATKPYSRRSGSVVSICGR